MMYTTTHTTFHSFDAFSSSLKWKRRLSKISTIISRPNHHHQQQHHIPWNAYHHHHHTPATVIAAATEKFASSSNHRYAFSSNANNGSAADIEIHSEDLTASQFAFLTGIKTHKRNSYQSSHTTTSDYLDTDDSDEDDLEVEDNDDDDDDDNDNDNENDDIENDRHLKLPSHHDIMMEHQQQQQQQQQQTTTSALSRKSAPVLHSTMKIWDSHFWQQPQKEVTTPDRRATTELENANAATASAAVHPASIISPSPMTITPTNDTMLISSCSSGSAAASYSNLSSPSTSSFYLSTAQQQLQTQPLSRNQSAPCHHHHHPTNTTTDITSKTGCSVIQKGRFKIMWGQGAELEEEEEKLLSSSLSAPSISMSTTSSVTNATHPKKCVEWKRKRAGSHGNTPATQ